MRKRNPESMVQEFARLAMELAVLNPRALVAFGEQMKRETKQRRAK